jgi:hypothetical protein
MAVIDPPFVVVVFDARITSDALTATGSGTITSAYTESGPEPGLPSPTDPASPWRPGIVGAQTRALEVTAIRGGYPGRKGAGLIYRLATDTDLTDYRGWSPPNLVTGWSSPPSSWGSADAWTRLAICTDPASGVLVAIGQDGTTSDAMTWSYDPRTGVWTDRYDWAANEGLTSSTFPTLVPDPDVAGRILLFAGKIGYYSDDLGSTFTIRSKDSIDAGNVSLDIAAPAGVDWLAAGRSSDGTLYASSDRGASWESLEDISAEVSANSARVVHTGTGFVVVYRRVSDNAPCARRLAHARASFLDADEIVIDSDASRDVTSVHPVVDEDGMVYVLARDLAVADRVRCYRSRDGGLTWARFRWAALSAAGDPDYLVPEAVTVSGGSVYVWARGSVITSVHLLRLGGWSTSESGTSQPSYARLEVERVGYGQYDGTSTGASGGLYLPADQPTDVGWTSVGVDGTAVVTSVGNPGLVITTAAGETRSYARSAGDSRLTSCGEAQLKHVTQSVAGVPFVSIELTDGAYSYITEIRISTTGVTAVDGDSGATLGTLAITTTGGVHLRWHVTQGTATVLAKLPTSTAWLEVCRDATVTNGTPVAGDDTVMFGHRDVGTGADVSHWYLVGAASGGAMLYGIDGAGYPDPSIETTGLAYGGPMPGAGSGGYPLPDATAAGEDVGRISSAGGPVAVNDRIGLPVEYQHAIGHVHPTTSPDPAEYWSARVDDVTVLTYDLGGASWLGGAIAVVALHATLRTVVVTSGTNPDGVTGWVTLGTLDLLLGELTFDRAGDTLTPGAGTDVIARYINEGELIGGWVEMPGATAQYRRVAANSGGYWSDAAGLQQVRIRLEGIDGTEDASGTCPLYHHSGVCLLYPASDTPRRYVRLTMEAIDTDDNRVPDAGVLSVGRVVGVGAAPGWAWTRRIEQATTITRSGDGTPSVREDGPPREVWSYSWAEGLAWGDARLAASPGDVVAVAGGAPIGTAEDAYGLQALLEHSTRSGEVPVVLVPVPPTTTAVTLTDPTRYLYGVPVSDAAVLSGFAGDEGVAELVRYDGVAVESVGGRTPRRSS